MAKASTTTAIPLMTSDTTPSGVASASGTLYSDAGAWKLFDGLETTQWFGDAGVQWIQYEFPEPKIIVNFSVSVLATDNSSYYPKYVHFEGYDVNNGIWERLFTQDPISWNTETIKNFNVTNNKQYKKYRILLTSTGGTNWALKISEIKMFEMVYTKSCLIFHEGKYKYYSDGWKSLGLTVSEQDYLDYGMNDLSVISELYWKELSGTVELCYYTDDADKTEVQFNIETEPFTLADELKGKEVKILEYTDNLSQVESKVETEVEPYTIYDEFGDTMEVLYYTDDPNKTAAELKITANYSPLDEIDEDFEVVTWSNNDSPLSIDLNAVVYPKFVNLVNPVNLHSDIQKITISESNHKSRYLFSLDKNNWKTWDGSSFIDVDTSSIELIYKNSMSKSDINKLTSLGLSKWVGDKLYIGTYLEDDIRDKNISKVDSINVESLMALSTSNVSNTKLYILNTISTINVTFAGSTIKGTLSDEDSTKVQYKVLLNGKNYYPLDGSFTSLQPSPLNISLKIPTSDVLIDKENKLRIEFQDYWGKSDYWETTFIGTYSGLLFLDKDGKYYSNDIGEVIQNLNFGVLIAGQTSIEQSIILKNTHGFTVNNIRIKTEYDVSDREGLEVQYSLSDNPFIPLKELIINQELLDQEQIKFFIRLSTDKKMNPANVGFDILVEADPVR